MFGQIFGAFWGGILGGVIWGKKLPFLNNFHILTIHFRLTLPQFFVPIILSTVMCVLLYPSFMSKHAVFAEKLVIFLPCLISVSRVRQGRGFTVGGGSFALSRSAAHPEAPQHGPAARFPAGGGRPVPVFEQRPAHRRPRGLPCQRRKCSSNLLFLE